MKKDISTNFYQKCLILCSKVHLNVLHNTSLTVVTMATYWVPDLPNIKGISGHLCHSILTFANGASYAWSSKHINMLAWVCGLVWCFLSWKSLTYWNQVGGDWKRVSCHGNRIFYSCGCVFCRTVSIPSFNCVRCKLAKIDLFIYLILYWVECMMSSVISFAYFTHFSNLNISGTNADICKW